MMLVHEVSIDNYRTTHPMVRHEFYEVEAADDREYSDGLLTVRVATSHGQGGDRRIVVQVLNTEDGRPVRCGTVRVLRPLGPAHGHNLLGRIDAEGTVPFRLRRPADDEQLKFLVERIDPSATVFDGLPAPLLLPRQAQARARPGRFVQAVPDAFEAPLIDPAHSQTGPSAVDDELDAMIGGIADTNSSRERRDILARRLLRAAGWPTTTISDTLWARLQGLALGREIAPAVRVVTCRLLGQLLSERRAAAPADTLPWEALADAIPEALAGQHGTDAAQAALDLLTEAAHGGALLALDRPAGAEQLISSLNCLAGSQPPLEQILRVVDGQQPRHPTLNAEQDEDGWRVHVRLAATSDRHSNVLPSVVLVADPSHPVDTPTFADEDHTLLVPLLQDTHQNNLVRGAVKVHSSAADLPDFGHPPIPISALPSTATARVIASVRAADPRTSHAWQTLADRAETPSPLAELIREEQAFQSRENPS